MQQYVYRMSSKMRLNAIPEKYRSASKFVFISSIVQMIELSKPLVARYGLSLNMLKLVLKILLKRNAYYAVIQDGEIASDGVVTFGRCKFYPVLKADYVIGPVFTNPAHRGKGFATLGLHSCIASLRKIYVPNNIYIDTSDDNFAMQSVIQKVGFGEHVLTYERN